MDKLDAFCPTTAKELHRVAIHKVNFLQIQHDAATGTFGRQQRLELRHTLPLNAAAEEEDNGSALCRSLNPQGHSNFLQPSLVALCAMPAPHLCVEK
jgi:hypothetical protein